MMEIIKSSTSEISFLVNLVEASIHEQDFIIINDMNKEPPEQYLAQVEQLIQTKEGEIKGRAIILGNINQENYSLSPCRFPISINAKILHPPSGLVSKVLSFRGDKGIYLGDIVISSSESDPFLLPPDFLERHVLCVASTGAGKSYSVGVLLEEILLKHRSAAVLLFDVHNEYWGIAQPNDGKEIELLDYEEYEPRGFPNNILLFEEESLCLGNYFSLPKLRRLVELTAAQENSLTNVLSKPLPLKELVSLIQESDTHSSTRENLVSKIHSLLNLKLFNSDLDFEALIQPGQVSIIRLDQFTDERKRNLVVNEILTQIFEKKIQGEIPREHEIVLIIEEAHRFASTKGIIPRIAREGRKFGIYEILISQRPGDLPDTIIANMNTLIALRIRSDKDLNKIRLMEGISTEIVSILPHLDRGEALIVGLQPHPMKIRVRPRLSKHIDPQEDRMPEGISRYKQFENRLIKTTDGSRDDPDSIDMPSTEEEKSLEASLDIEPIDYKDLTNLLACKHILILHKNTGICIYELGTSMLIIDPQLVSGFLSAISGLFSELKTQDTVKERTIVRIFTEEIGDRAFKIITVEGTYSITAAILDRTPKFLNRFKQRIREFVYAFETELHDKLEGFVGVLDHFTSAIILLDTYFGLSLTTPIQINAIYDGEISHPLLFNIINDQMNQLASFEGVFVEEIVNQCLLDSDYNYKEITKTIITYLRDGILVLKNPNRILPHFESTPIVSPETISQIPDSISSEESEDIILKNKELEYLSKAELDSDLQETEDQDISWFTEILSEINISPLPDSIKGDILERDLTFESDFRIKASSLRTETFSESDLLYWAKIVTQKQFVLDQKSLNPLNGVKIILTSDLAKLASSITKLKSGDYLLILAEIL